MKLRKIIVYKMNNRGITLVELLIYLGLSIIMLVILSELFVTILNESLETQNYSLVQTDGRYIMTRLRVDINNADAVTMPAFLGETTNELRVLAGGQTYRYYLSGDGLYFNDGTGEYLMSNPNSTVSAATFTRTGNAGGKQVINISYQVTSGEEGTAQHELQLFKGSGGLR